MNLEPILEQIIQEEVYGNNAIVYHRTRVEDIIHKVFDSGWKPGANNFYGSGFYSTYLLSSQLSPSMEGYGDYIGKFAVNTDRFLIFVYDNFLKSPVFTRLRLKARKNEEDFMTMVTPQNFIKLQLDYYKVSYDPKISLDPSSYRTHGDLFLKLFSGGTKRIDVLLKRYNIRGFIYIGDTDGEVLVSYDLRSVYPITIAKASSEYNNNDLDDVLRQFKENAGHDINLVARTLKNKVASQVDDYPGARHVKDGQLAFSDYFAELFAISTDNIKVFKVSSTEIHVKINSGINIAHTKASQFSPKSLGGRRLYLYVYGEIFSDILMQSFSQFDCVFAHANSVRVHKNLLDLKNFPKHVSGKLDMRDCRVKDFTNLPSGVTELIASRSNITSLVGFPDTIEKLDVRSCKLTSLNGLPNSVKVLLASHNRISDVSALNGKSFHNLDLFMNNVESFENVNFTVSEEFVIDENPLKTLKGCPPTNLKDKSFEVSNLFIESVEGLPTGLNEVRITECENLTSLKGMPSVTGTISINTCPELKDISGDYSANLLYISDCPYITSDTVKPDNVGHMEVV